MKEVAVVQVAAGALLRARLNERNTLSFALEYVENGGSTFVQITAAEADVLLRMRQPAPWSAENERQAESMANAR